MNWDMQVILTKLVEKLGSQRAVAHFLGCSLGYTNDMILGRREVGAKVAKRLGFTKTVERKVTYTKILGR